MMLGSEGHNDIMQPRMLVTSVMTRSRQDSDTQVEALRESVRAKVQESMANGALEEGWNIS